MTRRALSLAETPASVAQLAHENGALLRESEATFVHPAGVIASAFERRFWLPNDSWRCITAFATCNDVFSLRTTSKEVNRQVDPAITILRLDNSQIADLIKSPSLTHLKTLRIHSAHSLHLNRLITHLETHFRTGLTLELHYCHDISSDNIARLSTLPLASLSLNEDVGGHVIDALAACRFAVKLVGTFSLENLIAASRIATLQTLHVYGGEIVDDEMGALFSVHPALRELSIRIGPNASSDAIAALARIPNLRDVSVACWTAPHFDAQAANAVAANPALENLEVRGQNLSEESFLALSQSVSLKTLKTEVRPGMVAIAEMASLRQLRFVNYASMDWTSVDLTSAENIARLSELETLIFDKSINFDAGALTTIIARSRVQWLEIREWYAPDEAQMAALLANTSLKALVLPGSIMPEAQIAALRAHPTLALLTINRAEYRREAGQLVQISKPA